MEKKINGLHHITVLASDPQRNYDFYTEVMGLRFIKKTVNFDAPDVYHFYFADEVGTPGTVLTFFPFPNATPGKRGSGEATTVSFSVPKGSLEFWIEHLSRHDLNFNGPERKFGYDTIGFHDPDGLYLELVEDQVSHLTGWETTTIPRKHSIRKFFGTGVRLTNSYRTEKLITDVFGFQLKEEKKNIRRYISGNSDKQAVFDIEIDPNSAPALQSAGSIHHIAWRTESDESQIEWIKQLRAKGYRTTDVIDRNYFHSIYFREPGGVLFEIATDQPGFMIDEHRDSLGEALKLPEQYESRREQIEKHLIPLRQKISAA